MAVIYCPSVLPRPTRPHSHLSAGEIVTTIFASTLISHRNIVPFLQSYRFSKSGEKEASDGGLV